MLLFDFGAQVAGYRSDMTRTLFVGPPRASDLVIYELVAAAQEAAFAALAEAVDEGLDPAGFAIDQTAREVIVAAGHGEHFGHGLGHGIGLATHELPTVSRLADPDVLVGGPTVFSVEPGVYLPGQTGVRIEDLVLFDPAARRLERLTALPARGDRRRRLSPLSESGLRASDGARWATRGSGRPVPDGCAPTRGCGA